MEVARLDAREVNEAPRVVCRPATNAVSEAAAKSEDSCSGDVVDPLSDTAHGVAIRVVELVRVDQVNRGVTLDVAGVVPDVRPNHAKVVRENVALNLGLAGNAGRTGLGVDAHRTVGRIPALNAGSAPLSVAAPTASTRKTRP